MYHFIEFNRFITEKENSYRELNYLCLGFFKY